MMVFFKTIKIVLIFIFAFQSAALFSNAGPEKCSLRAHESIVDAENKLKKTEEELPPKALYTQAEAENLAPFYITPNAKSWKSVSVKFDPGQPSTFSVPVIFSTQTNGQKVIPTGQYLTKSGRPYTFIRPNGSQFNIYLADQKIFIPVSGNNVSPLEHLNLLAKELGNEPLEIVPLTFKNEGKIEHVQGGVRRIYVDKKTGDLYKYNIDDSPDFSLNMRMAENLVTRYFNHSMQNSAAELGIEISAVPHNYTYAEIGWSSQKKISGKTLYEYRKSLSGGELKNFNEKLKNLKLKLANENLTVAEMIDRELPATGHLYKGIGEKSFTHLSEWQRHKLSTLLVTDVASAIKKRDLDFVQEIMQKYRISPMDLKEIQRFTKAVESLNQIPTSLRDIVSEYIDLAHQRALYGSFAKAGGQNPYLEEYNQINKQIIKIRAENEKNPLFKKTLEAQKEIYLTLSPHISDEVIKPEVFKWNAQNGHLADIDTGLIHTNTPHGFPTDLNNCLVTGVKLVEGKKIEVIECFDVH